MSTNAKTILVADDESHILSFFNEPQTVESVCARSYLSNFVTCRTLWGMLAVNLLQDNAEAGAAIDEKRAAQQSEYELEAELSVAIARINAGDFRPTPDEFICAGCPALDVVCAGPRLHSASYAEHALATVF